MSGRGRGQAASRQDDDSPTGTQASRPPSDLTIRGRGGFRYTEFNTIPSGTTSVRASVEKTSKAVEVLSNFVRVLPMAEKEIVQYRVDFEPVIESTPLRRVLLRVAFGTTLETGYTFDGVSDLRSSWRTAEKVLVETAKHPRDESMEIQVTLKQVGVVNWSSFEMLRLYNMHAKDILRALGFYQISNLGAYVNPEIVTPVGSGADMAIVRGFKTSTNVHMGDNILMNLESVHKIMQSKNVLENLRDYHRQPNFREVARGALQGKLVVTSYAKRVYKIEDINFDMSPMSTFSDRKAGADITYVQYYEQRYDIRIRDPNQPLLLAVENNKKKGLRDETPKDIYLVPELCNIAGLTQEQRNDNRLKMDLIRSCQVAPKDRVDHMNTFLNKLHSTRAVSELLNKWGYSFEKHPLKISARVLAVESIGLGKKAELPPEQWAKIDNNASFDSSVTRESLAQSPEFPMLKVLVPRSCAQDEAAILEKIRNAFDKLSLKPQSVDVVRMFEGDQATHYVQYLKNMPPNVTATIVLMPSQNKDKYDAIKKIAACERGIVTQVVTGRLMTDQRKASGAALKIGIQIAAKIGGEPWYVNLPLKGAMVCGYDTYHDTLQRGRSFGAFVASMNARYSRWYSKADQHDRLEELSSHLTENLILALRQWRNFNDGRYPDRVFIYRDGVSDGQLEHVFNVEVAQLRQAVRGCDSKIRLTVIVVNKKIGARFFLRTGNTFANCPPGTIVDDTVTRKERYDFYLISQSTRAGTVSPTYYNIVHDESGLVPGIHQAMAYKFCFLYYNWTGSVRVPAPCQYAHKLALLCGEHLHAVPNTTLDDRLHFL